MVRFMVHPLSTGNQTDLVHYRLRLQERPLLNMREADSRYDWLCYELEMKWEQL